MSNKQKAMIALGILVSALFLWFAFRDLNPGAVLEYIGQVNPLLLVAGAVLYTVAMLVITWRWGFLLRSMKPVSIRKLYQLVAIGYMGNNVYPFRSGELLRIVMLSRSEGIPFARVATTVFVERIFDGIVLLSYLFIPLLFIENTSQAVRTAATFAAPIFITALVVFFVMALRPDLLRGLVRFVTGFLPQKLADVLTGLAEDVILGLQGLRTPRDLVGTVFASYLTWAIEAGVYWFVAFAFGLELGYPVMLLTVAAVNLAGLLPATPGQVGVFEFFASAVLIGVGVPEAQALAYALLVHVVIWLTPTLIGFAALVKAGLNFSAVTHAREIENTLETPPSNSPQQPYESTSEEIAPIR